MDERFTNRVNKSNNFRKLESVLRDSDLNSMPENKAIIEISIELGDIAQKLDSSDEWIARVSDKLDESGVRAGQAIVLIGMPGITGTKLLSDNHKDELMKNFTARFIETECDFGVEDMTLPAADDLSACKISAVISVAEGGLNRALYELGKSSNKGFYVDRVKVPVKQVTIEFCELYDADPWSMLSNGALIVCDRANSVKDAVSGCICTTIGYISEDKKKIIAHDGEESLLNRPSADELLTIIKGFINDKA